MMPTFSNNGLSLLARIRRRLGPRRLLASIMHRLVHRFALVGRVKALLSQAEATRGDSFAALFDASIQAQCNINISPKDLHEKFLTIAAERKSGNREERFLQNFEIAVCESFYAFELQEALRQLREYLLYIWEAEHVLENHEAILRRTIALLEAGDDPVPDDLRLVYTGMMAQIGAYREVATSCKKLKSQHDLARHLGIRAVLYECDEKHKKHRDAFELFSRLRDNEKLFSQLVHEADGDVRIIGNGPQILGTGLGPEIDASGLVIRFNTFETAFPYSSDCGTKTDIWVRMVPSAYIRREPDVTKLRCVMVTSANRLYRPFSNWEWFEANQHRLPGLCLTPSQPFIDICRHLGRIPTAGMLLAYMLYREIGPLPEGAVLGASFTSDEPQSDNYHNHDPRAKMSNRHDISRERAFYQMISGVKSRKYYTPLEAYRLNQSHNAKENSISDENESVAQEPEIDNISKNDTENAVHGDDQVREKTAATDIKSAYAAPKYIQSLEWNVTDYIRQFNTIYTTSKGLTSYKLSEKNLQFYTSDNEAHIQNSDGVLVVGFGLRGSGQKALRLRESLNANVALAEFGLISGLSIPSKTPFKFSLILDDLGIFFDTTRPSRTLRLLEEDPTLEAPKTIERAKKFISTIVENDIVKYNDAPLLDLETDPKRHKVLVIDQTQGDLSISLGGCTAYSFNDMLDEATSDKSNQVFLKLHPETVQGAKGANFDIDRLRKNNRITLLEENCNIMHLIKQMDEIYTMTSGAGLEALMAGKKVRCFGKPFYSGWGLTKDMQPVERPRKRSVEEIVAAIFFRQTLWFDPETQQETTPEDALGKLIKARGELPTIGKIGGRSIILSPENKHERKYLNSIKQKTDTIDIAIGKSFITEDDIVLDAGANIGFTAICYAGLKAKRVDAFEPVSKFYDRLNQLSDDVIFTHQYALGDFDGESEISISTAHDQGSTLSDQMVSKFRDIFPENLIKETIQVRQLDSLIEEGLPAPTFVKIDIEGFELEMLNGAKKLFENNPPKAVQIELYEHQFGPVSEWLLNYYGKISRAVQHNRTGELNLISLEKEIDHQKYVGIMPPIYIFEEPRI